MKELLKAGGKRYDEIKAEIEGGGYGYPPNHKEDAEAFLMARQLWVEDAQKRNLSSLF